MTVKNHDEDGTQASAAASLASLEDVTVPQLDFEEDPSGSLLLELTEFGGREVAAIEEARVWWDRAAALVAAIDDDDDDDDFALTCASSSLIKQDDENEQVGSARDADNDNDNDTVSTAGADGVTLGTSEAATDRVNVVADDDHCSRVVVERASMDALHELFWARPFAEIAGFVAVPVRPPQACEIQVWREVLANLAVVIEDVIDVPAARVSPQSRFIEDLGVDSINAIEIGLHIEEVYRVRVPDEMLHNLHTVGDAVDYIASQCQGTGGRVMGAPTSPAPDTGPPPELPTAAAPSAASPARTAASGRSTQPRKTF